MCSKFIHCQNDYYVPVAQLSRVLANGSNPYFIQFETAGGGTFQSLTQYGSMADAKAAIPGLLASLAESNVVQS